MNRNEPSPSGPSIWSGAWSGVQLAWMLIEGLLILRRDLLAGLVCLGGCLALSALGLFIWSRRRHGSNDVAALAFAAIMSIAVTVVVVVIKTRGADNAMSGGVSTHIPYWALISYPATMTLLFAMRLVAKRRGESRDR